MMIDVNMAKYLFGSVTELVILGLDFQYSRLARSSQLATQALD